MTRLIVSAGAPYIHTFIMEKVGPNIVNITSEEDVVEINETELDSQPMTMSEFYWWGCFYDRGGGSAATVTLRMKYWDGAAWQLLDSWTFKPGDSAYNTTSNDLTGQSQSATRFKVTVEKTSGNNRIDLIVGSPGRSNFMRLTADTEG